MGSRHAAVEGATKPGSIIYVHLDAVSHVRRTVSCKHYKLL